MSRRLMVLAAGLAVLAAFAPSPARSGDGYADEVRRRVAGWETAGPPALQPAVLPPPTGKRVSLHAGLDRLTPAKYPGVPPLAAAAGDARRLYEMAEKYGFRATRLTDEQATVGRVLEHMRAATQELTAGDLYLVTFSGHGAMIPDFNGDQYPRLTDQAFCLYDRMLVDDEVVDLWPKFRPGVRVLILLDACHSGTSEQAAAAFEKKRFSEPLMFGGQLTRGLGGQANVKVRAIPREPHKEAARVQDAELRAAVQNLKVGDAIKDTKATVVRLAACKGDQVAVEFGGQGLFTRTLIELFKEYPTASYRDLLNLAGERIGVYQEPTMDHYGPEVDSFIRQTALRP